jgi:lipopolysaccharide assembly outer membrane protein LptD (OstA)
VLVPFISLAQDTHGGKAPPSIKIHYEKIKMRQDNMTITKDNTGNATFEGDRINIDGPVFINIDDEKKTGKKKLSKDWTVVANTVELSNATNHISLKADVLSYNNSTQTGVLLGHVTTVENGTEKRIGTRAVVDFCNDEYRIVSVQ